MKTTWKMKTTFKGKRPQKWKTSKMKIISKIKQHKKWRPYMARVNTTLVVFLKLSHSPVIYLALCNFSSKLFHGGRENIVTFDPRLKLRTNLNTNWPEDDKGVKNCHSKHLILTQLSHYWWINRQPSPLAFAENAAQHSPDLESHFFSVWGWGWVVSLPD